MSQPDSSILRNLPARIIAARKAMKLTQAQFGSLGGVGTGAQHRYEAGTSEPSASYLSGLAAAGVDVMFLLTGRKGSSLMAVDTSELVGCFERLNDDLRLSVLKIARASAVASDIVEAALANVGNGDRNDT